jgi:hypothetical protein
LGNALMYHFMAGIITEKMTKLRIFEGVFMH